MSKEYPCVHYDEGKCNKLSNCKVRSWRVQSPCKDQALSNGDHIRAMSDEALAIFVRAVVIAEGCPNGDVSCKECPAFAICNQSGLYGHEMEWLKRPAE